ncbi:hypothetical protein [Streptomyces sp. NBC_01207]|uniref:hypothetical protein n=1 Tax=Streptomyces sp. NBC_01207 TaxID=2903772 RepID=UPI002E0DE1DD|nr:hypothetical protein OG457_01190 [Streptomyces sp. NBC_01207]
MVKPSLLVGQAPEEGEEERRLLLRFAAPRDPALIAKWFSYQIFNTECQDWRRCLEAAWRYREREGEREGELDVPCDHRGRVPARQVAVRPAVRLPGRASTGPLDSGSRTSTGKAGWAKASDRAQWRAAQLAGVAPDWNPREHGWTVNWQRPCPTAPALPSSWTKSPGSTAIVPGVTRHREDIGRWLATQRPGGDRLNAEQQRRLGELGVKPQTAVRRADPGERRPAPRVR